MLHFMYSVRRLKILIYVIKKTVFQNMLSTITIKCQKQQNVNEWIWSEKARFYRAFLRFGVVNREYIPDC
jgi:hypothetical protein